jgi:hypothetical protein
MSKRATSRPRAFTKPGYWDTVPAPAPRSANEGGEEKLSPTRYGDWVRKGIAVDF